MYAIEFRIRTNAISRNTSSSIRTRNAMQKYMTTYEAIERMSVRVKRTRFMGGGAISLSSRRAKTDAADLDSCRAYISGARRNWIILAGSPGDIL